MKVVLLACILWGTIFVSVDSSPLDYQLVALKLHNKYRKAHGVPMFTMNDELNHRAIKCAAHYQKVHRLDHSCPYKGGAGENLLAAGGCSSNMTKKSFAIATGASNAFYGEIDCYEFFMSNNLGTMNPGCISGHFTQLIWRESRILGFGFNYANCTSYGVALYYPPGNYLFYPSSVAKNVPAAIRPVEIGSSNSNPRGPAGLLAIVGFITFRYLLKNITI